jgi:hypothetical protein
MIDEIRRVTFAPILHEVCQRRDVELVQGCILGSNIIGIELRGTMLGTQARFVAARRIGGARGVAVDTEG